MTQRLVDSGSSLCDINSIRYGRVTHKLYVGHAVSTPTIYMTANFITSACSRVRAESVVLLSTIHFPAVTKTQGRDDEIGDQWISTKKPETKHTDVGINTMDLDVLSLPKGGERKRDKFKKFVADKGPRLAGAAAAVGMFIFNVVSSCA